MRMNFLDKIFSSHKQKRSVSTLSGDLSPVWTYDPKELTNASLGMKIATVYRCLEIVCGTVASLGIDVQRRKMSDLGRFWVLNDSSSLHYLLNYKPNSRQTGFSFWYNTIWLMHTRGNAYILPILSSRDFKALVLLSPDSCNYNVSDDTYTVNDSINHISGIYSSDEMIHIRNVCIDGGYLGVSTLFFAGKTLGIASKIDDQQADMYEPGATLRGFISGERSPVEGLGAVQDDQLSAVSEKVRAEIESGRRIWDLPGLMKFNQLSLTPADLQLLDSKRFGILEICRFFGVHPDKVFSQQSTNYAASQNSQTVFLSDTLQPILRKIENELQTKLIPRELNAIQRIKFSFDEYYQTDLASKADYYTKMMSVGAMTVNDIRIMEGREPIEGGDRAMITCNVAPIDSVKITGEKLTDTPTGGTNSAPSDDTNPSI